MTSPNIETAINILKQRFGDRLSMAASVRQHHSHTTTQISSELPDAVVFAHSTEEVAAVVSICQEYTCPIIPFGIGSSLEGHVNAPKGGVSIDMNAMDKVLAVHEEDLNAVVQPGVTREALNTHLRDKGLFFPIDPGANASLGGMAATRASGTNAVRYGTMKDNIIALEAVMADGKVIRTGSRAKKSSAGYDLTRLLIGSEGTLGIITELTVKLHGIPETIAGGICSFPSIEAACNAVITTIQYGIPVARMELLDAVQVQACNQYSGLDLPEETLLLVEFHGTESSVREQSEMFGEISSEYTPHSFQWTTDPEERAKLWKARHDAFWAAMALLPGGQGISTDVCVPISRLAECVEETRRDIEATGIIAPIVGHVGDGNFHTLPMALPDDAETWAKIKGFSERLSERAITMGGTCTGEHGIGQGKIAYLRKEMGPAVDVMIAIKKALDHDDILNPGKLFGA
ncbi:MAG: FAD-binding oxidoreductase [Candidatus Puniceispirillum sp. TMED52]|nr:FAD-binding oxidoreductase [SAR116 cluster bacterium]OUU45203.1 MAG: FAD-binding oxidoreductase [Candidatus Puniceispirillum sp. TMED52]HCP18325.1 FAD-binding oxidoreductase [Alphaproteobacteria bacterium]